MILNGRYAHVYNLSANFSIRGNITLVQLGDKKRGKENERFSKCIATRGRSESHFNWKYLSIPRQLTCFQEPLIVMNLKRNRDPTNCSR